MGITCKHCQQSGQGPLVALTYPVYNHHKGFYCTRAGRTCQEDICEGCFLKGGDEDAEPN